MKFKSLFIIFFTLFISYSATAKGANNSRPILTIKFTFNGIVDSCNYINKIDVFIDGEKLVTSTEKKQSETNSVSLKIKKGKYKIKIVDEVFFLGKWEEQTIANNYNIDAIYESNLRINGNTNINLLFDLDKGVSIIP